MMGAAEDVKLSVGYDRLMICEFNRAISSCVAILALLAISVPSAVTPFGSLRIFCV